jgi:hypothetical protein
MPPESLTTFPNWIKTCRDAGAYTNEILNGDIAAGPSYADKLSIRAST